MRRLAIWTALGSILLVAGFASGYVFSMSWARDLLRHEVELILADLLEGEVEIDEVRLALSNGLALQGRGLRAYPSERGHALEAKEAYIELNEAAVLLGEFELALLVLDDVVLRADLRTDGGWTFPPLQSLQNRTVEVDENRRFEPVLRVLAGAEEAARFLLEEERIADRIIVNRGAIHFEDHAVTADAASGTKLQRFQLEQIEGMLTRPWLSGDGQLALTGTLEDPYGHEVPVRVTAFIRDGGVELALAAAGLDLDALDAYVDRLAQEADLAGSVGGEVRLQAAAPGVQNVEVDVALAGVAPTLVLGDEIVLVDLPMGSLSAKLEIEPDVVRLIDGRLAGPRVALDASASVVRPVSAKSQARIEAHLSGLGLDDVGPIIDQLAGVDSITLREWFRRTKSGVVDVLALSGSTTLNKWGQLLEGELQQLPPNFLLGMQVSSVTVELDEDDRIVDASFQVDWADDRLEVRNAMGSWRGSRLPTINVAVDGLSRFGGMQSSPYETDAAPLPGLPLAWDLLLEDPDDHEADDASPNRFLLEFDYLDHPVLRWPIENARVSVQQIPHGTESVITEAIWGGFPVIGEVVYLLHPEPVLTVGLQAPDAEDRAGKLPAPDRPAAEIEAWGRGRFRLEPAADETHPALLSHMSGNFLLAKSEIRFNDVKVTVSESAHVDADVGFDLGYPDRLLVDFQGRIDDANMDHLGVAIGLPEKFITGQVDIEADIEGELTRDENLYAGLHGTIHAAAEDGEIRQSVPLAVAVATATDGFNPFAKRDVLQYETIETDLILDHGRLRAEKVELEGPVRIYATGTLDFATPPQEVDAIVGVFIFQRFRELLGKVPLMNLVLPGSNKGMVGAYFRVHGPWEEPEVETMALKTLREGAPDLLSKPFDLLEWLWEDDEDEREEQERTTTHERKEEKRKEKVGVEKAASPS